MCARIVDVCDQCDLLPFLIPGHIKCECALSTSSGLHTGDVRCSGLQLMCAPGWSESSKQHIVSTQAASREDIKPDKYEGYNGLDYVSCLP